MAIDRIEVFVTDLPARLVRRTAGSGSDTGASRDPMGKPIMVRLFADGVVGYGQVRPTGRNHFLPDTSYSVVAAIRDYYGPRLIGAELADFELLWADFDRILPKNGPARCVIDYALHDALVKPMPGNPAAPSLAEAWRVSPDGLVYEFALRRGVVFHNGDTMTAEDVKFSFERYRGAAAAEGIQPSGARRLAANRQLDAGKGPRAALSHAGAGRPGPASFPCRRRRPAGRARGGPADAALPDLAGRGGRQAAHRAGRRDTACRRVAAEKQAAPRHAASCRQVARGSKKNGTAEARASG